MLKTRVIPCLLLKGKGLVKTIKFQDPKYVGDPINAIKIFNDKEVDELIFLDITATVERRSPPYKIISEIASECFIPLAYGGGITSLDQIKLIFSLGVEKVILNSSAFSQPELVREAAHIFGSQSIVVAMDVKKSFWGGYRVFTESGKADTGFSPVDWARKVEALGAGEIFLNSIDRDGTGLGYDTALVRSVSSVVEVPVIACGGAGKLADFSLAVKEGGASAVAAGSMFVFHGKFRSVLISYPSILELERVLR